MGLRNKLGLIPFVIGYITFLSCSLGMYLFKVSIEKRSTKNSPNILLEKFSNYFGKIRFHDTERGKRAEENG